MEDEFESFVNSSILEEDLQDNFEVRLDGNNTLDPFDIVLDISNTYFYDEVVVSNVYEDWVDFLDETPLSYSKRFSKYLMKNLNTKLSTRKLLFHK